MSGSSGDADALELEDIPADADPLPASAITPTLLVPNPPPAPASDPDAPSMADDIPPPPPSRFDAYFSLSARGSTLSTEILAGGTTFLSLCYLLTVNPTNLTLDPGGPPRWASVFIATCLASSIGCLTMALVGRVPYVLAPGMGLSSAIGSLVAYGYGTGRVWSYDNAMCLTMIYALVVLIVTVVPGGFERETGRWIPLRERLFDGIPACCRNAIPPGIGLFIALIGVEQSKMILGGGHVFVQLIDWSKLFKFGVGYEGTHDDTKSATVCFISLMFIAVLAHFEVKGSVIVGILIGTLAGIPLGVSDVSVLAGKGNLSWRFWEHFRSFGAWNSGRGGVLLSAFRGFNFPSGSALSVVMHCISFGIIDLFDTMGTVIGCSRNAGLMDDQGKPKRYGATMWSDSIASLAASLLGTASVTTCLESGAGIAAGGKTGVVPLSCAVFFLLSVFFLPLFAFIPIAAASAALIYVGVSMVGSVGLVDFRDETQALPAFLTIVMMPFTYSITKGIGIGLLSYVIIKAAVWVGDAIEWAVRGKKRGDRFPEWEISIVSLVVGALFVVYFFVPLN
jgi:AGZA family xanthine/uracil permease-like MFS transporter